METAADIREVLKRFEGISLAGMDSVQLMDRIDTKYVTKEGKLGAVLGEAAAAGCRVLEIHGERLMEYESLYYDTPDLQMYTIHRSGHADRQKIRVRTYGTTGTTFLEVKRKSNKGRTKKKRMPIPTGCMEDFRDAAGAEEFVETWSRYGAGQVEPACGIRFRRITLVNREKTERVTIDTGIAFDSHRTGEKILLEDAVIIEVKQGGRTSSRFKEILRSNRIHPSRVSKYCIGTVLTDPSARPGRFREKIRDIEKTTNRIYWI